MSDAPNEQDALLQEHINDFKAFYRDHYEKSKRNLKVAYQLRYIGVGILILWFYAGVGLLGISYDHFWMALGKLILIGIAYIPIDNLYRRLSNHINIRRGYLEERPIMERHVENIVRDIGLTLRLKILFKGDELKENATTKNNLLLSMPITFPLVVCSGDLKGNKFYLSATGPELDVEVVRIQEDA